MTREEEGRIIRRVLDGDTQAFEALVTAHEKKLYNLCLRMTGNPEDAFDLSQEAFFKAFRSLGGFRGDSGFQLWLCRLASNLCIDFLRKRKRRPQSALAYVDEDGRQMDIELPDERYTPERLLETKLLREEMQNGLCTLTPDHRSILVMREVTGLSYEEIGRALEINAGTVKSRLARARKKLADYMAGNIPGGKASMKRKEHEGR